MRGRRVLHSSARVASSAAVVSIALTGSLAACGTTTGSTQSAPRAVTHQSVTTGSALAGSAQAPGTATQAPASVQAAPSPTSVVAAPAPRPAVKPVWTPCTHNRDARLVQVSVAHQHAWMCARHRLVYQTPVTTGAVDLAYRSTPTGTFHIQGRDRNSVLTLNTGAQYTVKYWIPFSAPLFGFHDSPWQKMSYGSQGFKTQGSHGCVHMPLPAMTFLYKWGKVGTTVRITKD